MHLSATPLLDTTVPDPIALVVATHPHDDHIRGMATFLRTQAASIDEVWEPGYYHHPTDAYFEMMAALDDSPLRHLQPASGTVRWLDTVNLTASRQASRSKAATTPTVEINDSPIVLKVGFPAARVIRRENKDRTYLCPPSQTVILGADAQTTPWAQVVQDFPQLGPDKTAVSQALRMQNGVEPLNVGVFKVPHHGSKRGLNFQLVEDIMPGVTLCGRDKGKYFFPHTITQEAGRDAPQPIATKPTDERSTDIELGIHYTGSQPTAASQRD